MNAELGAKSGTKPKTKLRITIVDDEHHTEDGKLSAKGADGSLNAKFCLSSLETLNKNWIKCLLNAPCKGGKLKFWRLEKRIKEVNKE